MGPDDVVGGGVGVGAGAVATRGHDPKAITHP